MNAKLAALIDTALLRVLYLFVTARQPAVYLPIMFSCTSGVDLPEIEAFVLPGYPGIIATTIGHTIKAHCTSL